MHNTSITTIIIYQEIVNRKALTISTSTSVHQAYALQNYVNALLL